MYSRLLKPPERKSYFLFGPRGTGKSLWVQKQYPKGLYIDLLEAEVFNPLSANPQRLAEMIPDKFNNWIILDEVQKIPKLLDEVHRLIEKKRYKFVLTGSSARKLRKGGVNLLAGRALLMSLYPLTARELGKDFNLKHSLKYGNLPQAYTEKEHKKFLESYVKTYLKEEVLQEGLTRNLGAFSRFLETASFSQGSILNISAVARDASVERKVVEDYFNILEDLLVAERIPVFTRRAKRAVGNHPKFYFFDCGIYKTLRPQGPLDSSAEIDGASLETLVFQELRAINFYFDLGYKLYYWQTQSKLEVDFILYGSQGLLAIEVKRTAVIRNTELKNLLEFKKDYPEAKMYLFYGGNKKYSLKNIEIIPITEALINLKELLTV